MKKAITSILLIVIIFLSLTSCNAEDVNDNNGDSDTLKATSSSSTEEKETADKNDASDQIYQRNENTVIFGSYPQSELTNVSIKARLNDMVGKAPSSMNPNGWSAFDYKDINSKNFMWYTDVEYNGEKYRAVYFTSYLSVLPGYEQKESNSNIDDNGYKLNTVYWFKYEPISWTIINDNNSSGALFLLSDLIIDSQQYNSDVKSKKVNGETIYANNYAESKIRAWLNDNFYNTAFSSQQKTIIRNTTVNNNAQGTGIADNSFACTNTTDKIFLLSYDEANRVELDVLKKKVTDYAKIQGISAALSAISSSSQYGRGTWWLRSSFPEKTKARAIGFEGTPTTNKPVNYTELGVVPALKIKT